MVLGGAANAQFLRSQSMGGVRYGLTDAEQGLGLYRFGGNPAALLRDYPADRLTIAPVAASEWGNYRRLYDPQRVNAFSVGFDGIKSLGEHGTFRGSTTYDVEKRYEVYRSIKPDPYAGEAFFVTDTTSGDFTFNGPTVAFAYAYELFPDVLIGADLYYSVQDGLKNVYSLASILHRNVGGTAGIAWEILPELMLGATLRATDVQDRIEAASEDLLDVELFNVRGDTYATRRRSSSLDHTARASGEEYGIEGFWCPNDRLEATVVSSYGNRRTKDLIRLSEVEYQQSGMQEETYRVDMRLRWLLADAMTVGASAGHRSIRQWTDYTGLDLLVWDLQGRETWIGAGMAWQPVEGGPLVATDCDLAFISSDSSKYIDNRIFSGSANAVRIRIGLEQELLPGFCVRGGYAFGHQDHDFVYGGDDAATQSGTVGIQVRISPGTSLEWNVTYGRRKIAAGASRSSLTTGVVLQLHSF